MLNNDPIFLQYYPRAFVMPGRKLVPFKKETWNNYQNYWESTVLHLQLCANDVQDLVFLQGKL